MGGRGPTAGWSPSACNWLPVFSPLVLPGDFFCQRNYCRGSISSPFLASVKGYSGRLAGSALSSKQATWLNWLLGLRPFCAEVQDPGPGGSCLDADLSWTMSWHAQVTCHLHPLSASGIYCQHFLPQSHLTQIQQVSSCEACFGPWHRLRMSRDL